MAGRASTLTKFHRSIRGRREIWYWNANRVSLMCAAAFLVIYVISVFPAMPGVGDAADYAALIRQGELGTRTCHVGYYLFAYPFALLGRALGVSTTLALNLLSAVCMAAAIGVACRLYRALGLEMGTSALAAVTLGFTGLYWYNAEFAELQAFLMLLVFSILALYLLKRPVLAGLLFAVAMITSQAGAAVGLCFPLIAIWQRDWRRFIIFGISFAASFGLMVAPIAHEYFYGPRGVFPSMNYYPQSSPVKMVLYAAYRLLENYSIWFIPMLFGIIVAWKRNRFALLFAAILLLGHAWLNLRVGHIEYGFAWMPAYLGASALAAIGAVAIVRKLWRRPGHRFAAVAAYTIAAAVITGSLYVLPKKSDAIALRAIIAETQATVGSSPVAATPHVGFVYVYETAPEIANVWSGNWVDVPKDAKGWQSLLNKRGEVYLLSYTVRPHLFRRALFTNPLASRFLSPEATHSYLDEGIDVLGETKAALPPDADMQQVKAWPNAELWRVKEVVR